MDNKYLDWIRANYPDGGYGECDNATKKMVEAFPELTRVRGHYYCIYWGQRAHWWCKTENGTIVDPTARQFPSGGTGVYDEWDEGQQEPHGKCMNCGSYCFDSPYFCSPECEKIVRADMGI